MRDEDKDKRRHEHSEPQGKRTGRDGLSPEAQPAEYTDDMRVNRFTPPPEPKVNEEKE